MNELDVGGLGFDTLSVRAGQARTARAASTTIRYS